MTTAYIPVGTRVRCTSAILETHQISPLVNKVGTVVDDPLPTLKHLSLIGPREIAVKFDEQTTTHYVLPEWLEVL